MLEGQKIELLQMQLEALLEQKKMLTQQLDRFMSTPGFDKIDGVEQLVSNIESQLAMIEEQIQMCSPKYVFQFSTEELTKELSKREAVRAIKVNGVEHIIVDTHIAFSTVCELAGYTLGINSSEDLDVQVGYAGVRGIKRLTYNEKLPLTVGMSFSVKRRGM